MDKISREWVSVLWLCAFVAGCGGGGGGSAPPPPAPPPPPPPAFRLVSATPADNAVGAAATTFIDLQFSSDILLPSVTSYTVRLHTRDGDVPAVLQVGTRTIRIAPTQRLAPNEAHTVSLITPLADTQGNMLQATQLHFTTAGPAWQAPQFARAGDCTTSGAGAALLDDGTLLLSCFSSTSGDTSIQRRDTAGQWQAALAAPTTTVARPSVRQLAGDQALVTWIDSGRTSRLGRVYRTGSGWGAVIAPPVPAAQVPAVDDFDTYGTDQQLVRARPWLFVEAGMPVVGERVYELVDATTGIATHAFRSEVGRVGAAGSGCVFPNGNRLYVFGTRNMQPTGNLYDWRFYAAIHTAGGWSTPVQLDNFTELAFTAQPVCAANGIARVFWANQAGTISRYADWTASQGWAAAQSLSSTQQLVYASFPAARRGSDASAVTFWSDFRVDPNGSTSDGTTRYAHVPRLFQVSPGGSGWVPLLGLPRYTGGTTHDTRVLEMAHNPATGRYAVIAQGGVTGNTERFFTDYSTSGGWSTPWTPLTAQGVSFAPARVYFNASGQGVALGLVQGQTYLSEWR